MHIGVDTLPDTNLLQLILEWNDENSWKYPELFCPHYLRNTEYWSDFSATPYPVNDESCASKKNGNFMG